MGEERTGGAALIPVVAEKILNTEIKKTGWKMVLPADISDMKDLDKVDLVLDSAPFFPGLPYDVKISFGNEVIDVLNVIPGKTTIIQGLYPANGYSSNKSALNRQSKEVIKGKEIQFIDVFAKFIGDAFSVSGKSLFMGDVLGKTSSPILVEMSCLNGVLREQSLDRVLEYKDMPVFVMGNK